MNIKETYKTFIELSKTSDKESLLNLHDELSILEPIDLLSFLYPLKHNESDEIVNFYMQFAKVSEQSQRPKFIFHKAVSYSLERVPESTTISYFDYFISVNDPCIEKINFNTELLASVLQNSTELNK